MVKESLFNYNKRYITKAYSREYERAKKDGFISQQAEFKYYLDNVEKTAEERTIAGIESIISTIKKDISKLYSDYWHVTFQLYFKNGKQLYRDIINGKYVDKEQELYNALCFAAGIPNIQLEAPKKIVRKR